MRPFGLTGSSAVNCTYGFESSHVGLSVLYCELFGGNF